MKTISQHIKHIHSKPHHVRRRVAFTAATAGAGVLAAAWLIASLGTGAFALKPTSFAQSEGEASVAVQSTADTGAQVAGAAAAPAVQDANAPAHIQIVDVSAPTSTSTPKSAQTTIPF
jgi:hypothetical protein